MQRIDARQAYFEFVGAVYLDVVEAATRCAQEGPSEYLKGLAQRITSDTIRSVGLLYIAAGSYISYDAFTSKLVASSLFFRVAGPAIASIGFYWASGRSIVSD